MGWSDAFSAKVFQIPQLIGFRYLMSHISKELIVQQCTIDPNSGFSVCQIVKRREGGGLMCP